MPGLFFGNAPELMRYNVDMEDVKTEVSGLIVSTRQLLEGQKDHETRLRRIEWFIAVLFGAAGIYKWFIAFPAGG